MNQLAVCLQCAQLKHLKSSGQISHYQATNVNGKWFVRNKDNSVTIYPEDGSYIRTINPSWYE
jgi:hypothetical protein